MSFGLVGILVEHADKLPVLLSRVLQSKVLRWRNRTQTGLKPASNRTRTVLRTVLVLFSNRTGTVPQYCYVVSTTANIHTHICRKVPGTMSQSVSNLPCYRITTYSSYLLYLFVTSFDSMT